MEFLDTSVVEKIDLKMIRPSKFLVRGEFDQKRPEIESLARSIREHGLLQPILIRPLDHGFEVVAGHRRLQACRHLRSRFISCTIREISDKQAYEIQLIENLQRQSMSPLEEAEAFRKYVDEFGWGGVTELSKKIGKSIEYVSHRMQLLKLPENVKIELVQNKISTSHAIELSTLDFDDQVGVIKEVIRDNLTIKEIRQLKSNIRSHPKENDSSYLNSVNKRDMPPPSIKLAQKISITFKITLARVDQIISEVDKIQDIENKERTKELLMDMRLRIHSMIDEIIHFKKSELNYKIK
ncbi:ParB/RepB/Spo0J family partition protein [Candidatus Nitrosotalea okcheonensis]|uniref:Putative transcriptional regulator n=1 Tax=Candidatus Nitrosotalea okcheonensis TaxID=1903276 RepID=A0A2H1FIK1_9ARCH|nr:ParB/RepB/Spo0J family partition protein [Candidatus Nitrosotalea okcheonensis]SMH72522.1 putative transcriptional regulator [Candidatus Nitrosotalea okcheonensis]